jgi:general secretion pathway protein G
MELPQALTPDSSIQSVKLSLIKERLRHTMPRLSPRLTHKHGSFSAEAGFTLLEILVVIAILGMLIALVAPAALRQLGNARISVANQSIERLASVLDLYKLDVGSYPTSEQGLNALAEKPAGVVGWNGPYLKGAQVPLDPWNHAYMYRSPSTHAGHEYDLCSHGPSGTATGTDMICDK